MIKLLFIYSVLFLSNLQKDAIRDIGIAMKAGSAKELINFCNATMEIRINGESTNYDKNQAKVTLRNFFNEYPPQDFSYTVKGSSSDNLKYTIGVYTHEKGSFRVVMFIKKIDNAYLIDTLNFSKE
ncbi:MAG: DUF4783 domain-containing protein [Ekhidna sp.]|nr:DUF4783 domain-containing protein [Ekhidna sp.]